MAVQKKPAKPAAKPAPKSAAKKPVEKKAPAKKQPQPVEEMVPEPPVPEYAGPVIVLFENPTQVAHVRDLLNQPQMLSGIDVMIRARVLECVFQGVPLKEFSDKIITSYQIALKRQRDEELVKQQQAAYEAGKDPNAKPVIANTPETILKAKR